MGYIQGIDRNQVSMISLDSMIDENNLVRLIDAFIESINLEDYGFKKKGSDYYAGRKSYDPNSLIKLYIYGNRNGIRSSRRLKRTCEINVEAMWLMKGVKPDFRTIADFRKDNIDAFNKVFHEFNSRIAKAEALYMKELEEKMPTASKEEKEQIKAMLEGVRFQSVDGSKFQACNSKDRNFTLSKLDDRIKRMDIQAEDYLRQLAQIDEEDDEAELEKTGHFTKEQLEEKLKVINERKTRYEGYLKEIQENGQSQKSLTDPDSKLMKNKNGYAVSYNPQVAVDSKTHLISDFQMTNNATDHGMLDDTLKDIRRKGEILNAVADKGYHNNDDMVSCLEDGIIPNVIPNDGQDSFELETIYSPVESADQLKASTRPEDFKKCIESGVVPEAYEDIISDIKIKERNRRIYEDGGLSKDAAKRSEYAMKVRAAQGYFVRDLDNDKVYCPQGEVLRKKSETKQGAVRYANKLACKKCPLRDKCMKNKTSNKYPFKVIEFADKVIEKPVRGWNEESEETARKSMRLCTKYHMEKEKIVTFKFTPNRQMMNERKCLSEHVFGTIKRTMNGSYFLLKGTRKVIGEFALLCMGYNLQRSVNLFGFDKMMEVMQG